MYNKNVKKKKKGTKEMKRAESKLETTKAERLYLMADRKMDCLLVKVGITRDKLANRFYQYSTANPMLVLVATTEIRKNQDLENVEKLILDFFCSKGAHYYGEWVKITDVETIEAIENQGFKALEKLWYRTKNHKMYNEEVCNLWNHYNRGH